MFSVGNTSPTAMFRHEAFVFATGAPGDLSHREASTALIATGHPRIDVELRR